MTVAGIIFVLSFVAAAHFIREAFVAFGSPEFRRDLARLRENRRLRRASRR